MKVSTPDRVARPEPPTETILWRISNHADLHGLGGERADGRWHTAHHGKRIVYLSENAATALLEVLANLKGDPSLFPDTYQLIKLTSPASLTEWLTEEHVTPGWQENPRSTQQTGDRWLAANRSALLAVPSVPAPESTNYLLNPLHPDATRVKIVSVRRIRYDKRLFQLSPA